MPFGILPFDVLPLLGCLTIEAGSPLSWFSDLKVLTISMPSTVIASRRLGAGRRPVSEAIHGRVRRTMDCFVANAPRNDGGR
jgi:hypothetical protein